MNNPENMSCDELVAEVKRLQTFNRGNYKGIRKQSKTMLWGLPLVSIAMGPNFEKGEMRGHAKGIIAIGDFATGVIAIGGIARGVVAFGGLALGLFSFGGCALSLLFAFGGLAVGAVAFGGCALGLVAIGGNAIGYYAVGGKAFGAHVIDSAKQSPEAVQFFERFVPGLTEMLRIKK